jgi:hypothetical protein
LPTDEEYIAALETERAGRVQQDLPTDEVDAEIKRAKAAAPVAPPPPPAEPETTEAPAAPEDADAPRPARRTRKRQ